MSKKEKRDSSKKVKEDKSRKEREGRRYLRDGRISDALDKFNEAVHEYQDEEKFNEAIELAEEGIRIAKEHRRFLEGSLLERALSELYAHLGNRELCFQHILRFRKMALDCGSKSQEQVSYHVEAWCIQQLYAHEVVTKMDIERAIDIARKSRELVEKNKRYFKESDIAGPANHRKAQIYILEAQLNAHLGNYDKSLQLLEKAKKFITANEKTIQFDMLRTKCSVVPIERRVEIAELMDEEAPVDKKAQALCELSHHYVLANRVTEGYRALAGACIVHQKQLGERDLEEAVKRLCIIYRLAKYLKIVKYPHREPKISKCELYEAVGDLYDRYFQTLLPKEKKEYTNYIRENILGNYEKMLEFKRNEEDLLRAYQGIALVYGDLDDVVKSKKYFELRLDLLKKMEESQDKIIDTRVSIFNCMCKLNYSNLDQQFEELKGKVERDDTKRELFEVWANYWQDQRNEENEKECREVVKSIEDVITKNEEDETDVLFGRLSNEDILDKCRDENELLKLDSLSEHKLRKKNDKGETILHQEAMKPNNEAVVEKLCRKGCDVNAKDYGGWTPLAEAVEHGQFGNVQVLIRFGADVNTRSTESFVSEESQSSSDELSHSGLTPLMDACTRGYIDIAQLLIDNKARVDLKDSAKWTAYHHLKKHMDDNGANEKMIKFADMLKNLTSSCTSFIDIPTCNIRTKKALPEVDDSPPDEEEGEMILAITASRKRRNSNSFENHMNHTKRRQRDEENIKCTPSPVFLHPSPNSAQKRSFQQPMAAFCKPNRLNRQNSSSSLNFNHRHSMSPRRSMSPIITVETVSPVFGADDDIQVVGVRRSNGKAKTPSPRVVQPSPAQQQIPDKTSEVILNDIVVKCCFKCPTRALPEVQPFLKNIKPETSIERVKQLAKENRPNLAQWRIDKVSEKDDKDEAELGESLLLSHIAKLPHISLMFHLLPPPADEVYQETSKNPINEVTNRLKHFSTEKQLDLSAVFLDSPEISEVINTFKKSEIPHNSQINLGVGELSTEDESNLQFLLDECSDLRITDTSSKTGFSGVFENTKHRLVKLEMIGIDFRNEGQIVKILKNCSNIKNLRLSGIRVSSNSFTDSIIPLAIRNLRNLVKLDLSFNSSWISDQTWSLMLKGLEKLEELTMNETRSDVQFESDWLPNLSSFSARGSDLHWDSIFELFSVLERINMIDVRFSTVDSSIPEELKARKTMTEVIY